MEYTVTITEYLQTDIKIQADSACEAESIASDRYYRSEVILTSENYIGAEFKADENVSSCVPRDKNKEVNAMSDKIQEYISNSIMSEIEAAVDNYDFEWAIDTALPTVNLRATINDAIFDYLSDHIDEYVENIISDIIEDEISSRVDEMFEG